MNTQVERFSAGETIFSEGEAGHCAYIIESGRIKIFLERPEETGLLVELGPGEIFGEMSVIDGSPRSASAAAISDCELTVVSSEQLSERIESADAIVRLLISMLLDRTRNSNLRSVEPEANSIGQMPGLQKIVKPKNKEVIGKMRLENKLRRAIENEEMALFYQPIVNMRNREVAGYESLIRWNSPVHGFVGPNVFIGIAEETSLIVPIGEWASGKSLEA